jgi:hypothetical protein
LYNAAGMSGSGDGRAEPGRELARRAAEVGRELERARFGGGNPIVEVPGDAAPFEVAARTLAAERFNALLRLGGRDYNPQQDAAEAGLDRAMAALRTWSFPAAHALLDGAGARAAEPALQQRIGLWKLLAALVQRLVRADPEEELRGDPRKWALEHLRGADHLPAAEREHYRAEVERVVREHAAARSGPDPLPRTLWYVLRARLALAADEPVLALAWCVRTARLNEDRLMPDEYLADLLERGRRYVLLAMGEIPPEEVAAVREVVRGLQAWDVYHALCAQLGRVHGLDVHRETARFSIAPYQETGEGAGAQRSL